MKLSKTALKTGKYTWHIVVNGNHVATIENATLARAKRIYASQIEGIKERCLNGKIKGELCTGVDNSGKTVRTLVYSINLVMEEYDVIIEDCGELLETSIQPPNEHLCTECGTSMTHKDFLLGNGVCENCSDLSLELFAASLNDVEPSTCHMWRKE